MRKRLSNGEWRVMNALWRVGIAATAADVQTELETGPEEDRRTIQTVLNRCVAKGWVQLERRRGRCYYTPALGRRQGVEERAAQILAELAEGDTTALEILRESLERELDKLSDDHDPGQGRAAKNGRRH